MSNCTGLPSFDAWCRRVTAAERAVGWLSVCEDQARYLAPNAELVDALAAELQRLAAGRVVLEVCAGHGELAAALVAAGLPIVAVDAASWPGTDVKPQTAEAALVEYRPAVVLGSFVPFDAGIDEKVLSSDCVEHYVVLGARINGLLGSTGLWNAPGWLARPLDEVNQWMLTRHDIWLGGPDQAILHHGEAWHFERANSRRFATAGGSQGYPRGAPAYG